MLNFSGKRIRSLREERGYSQEELAGLIDCDKAQVWRWEKEDRVPSTDLLARMADLFDVSTDYLLGLTDDRHFYRREADLQPAEKALLSAYRLHDWPRVLALLAQASSTAFEDTSTTVPDSIASSSSPDPKT
jgi:transcriptional regulator with XRE-family HTH domain